MKIVILSYPNSFTYSVNEQYILFCYNAKPVAQIVLLFNVFSTMTIYTLEITHSIYTVGNIIYKLMYWTAHPERTPTHAIFIGTGDGE